MTNDRHWYVAYVMACREKKAAERLSALGYRCYLPVRKVVRQWSDRKKVMDQLVLPRMIFVYCNENERLRSLEDVDALYRYITVCGAHTPAVIRDSEMETFIRMVEQGGRDVSLSDKPVDKGDLVEVVSGPLQGSRCEVVSVNGRRCYVIRLGSAVSFLIEVSMDELKRIEKDEN